MKTEELEKIGLDKDQIAAVMKINGKEEKEAIRQAQYIYGLEDAEDKKKREFSPEEKQKIDDVDQIREKKRKNLLT